MLGFITTQVRLIKYSISTIKKKEDASDKIMY